ncbi:hypothetical protein J4405_02490 [Candidatus Woesearchaeota archaeon]|nr:hypothetical protein [Candidatus Woesearchaeota archaeon]
MTNKKVIIYSIIALICIVLTFTINWIFIVPAFILMILNQKEIIKK